MHKHAHVQYESVNAPQNCLSAVVHVAASDTNAFVVCSKSTAGSAVAYFGASLVDTAAAGMVAFAMRLITGALDMDVVLLALPEELLVAAIVRR